MYLWAGEGSLWNALNSICVLVHVDRVSASSGVIQLVLVGQLIFPPN